MLFVAAAMLGGCGGGDAGSPSDARALRTFKDFPVYWLGSRFERWELTAVSGLSGPDGFVSLIYGGCTPHGGDEPSCTPPVAVQVSALCSHLAVVARAPTWEHRRIRGAPVGTIDSAPVLLTRGAQIKVHRGVGADQGVALRALRALRSLNRAAPVVTARDRIPGPAGGVRAAVRRCGAGRPAPSGPPLRTNYK